MTFTFSEATERFQHWPTPRRSAARSSNLATDRWRADLHRDLHRQRRHRHQQWLGRASPPAAGSETNGNPGTGAASTGFHGRHRHPDGGGHGRQQRRQPRPSTAHDELHLQRGDRAIVQHWPTPRRSAARSSNLATDRWRADLHRDLHRQRRHRHQQWLGRASPPAAGSETNGNPGAPAATSTAFMVDTVTPTVAVTVDSSDVNLAARHRAR